LLPLDIDTCILCKRPDGREYGLNIIMHTLEEHCLPGVFFVDAAVRELCDTRQFDDLCRQIVRRGHDLQLHLHPRALAYARQRRGGAGSLWGSMRSDRLCAYEPPTQLDMLRQARSSLTEACGVKPVAFRAGNYAADATTLDMLAEAGFQADFSYNASFPMPSGDLTRMNAPRRIGRLVEFPVTQLLGNRTPWDGCRPFEINALTAGEICDGLMQLRAGGQRAAVMVFHCFSLLKNRTARWESARPDAIVRRRFEAVLRFLSANTDSFCVARISDLAGNAARVTDILAGTEVWPRTAWLAWAKRYTGQAMSRL
jgi:peptidoglycan/xylan/chitin deacetylase (PgdA/CDA1 family)